MSSKVVVPCGAWTLSVSSALATEDIVSCGSIDYGDNEEKHSKDHKYGFYLLFPTTGKRQHESERGEFPTHNP